jgi:hypothetical protein
LYLGGIGFVVAGHGCWKFSPGRPSDTIIVTTKSDSLDAMDGHCEVMLPSNVKTTGDKLVSLREAICAANNTPSANTILLATRVYELTLSGVEDENESGDLDILASGGDLTIRMVDDLSVIFRDSPAMINQPDAPLRAIIRGLGRSPEPTASLILTRMVRVASALPLTRYPLRMVLLNMWAGASIITALLFTSQIVS